MSINPFIKKRMEIMDDKKSSEVSPKELLLHMIDLIDSGELPASGIAAVVVIKHPDNSISYDTFRCSLLKDEEVVAYTVAQARALKIWGVV